MQKPGRKDLPFSIGNIIMNNDADTGGGTVTTGEKLAVLRKNKGITQEQLAELLKVSRQSVSRWEMDAAFPETEKLVKLSKILDCSIDFLLNDNRQEPWSISAKITANDCFQFIRECGYFFLATSADGKPKLRPMGMLYSDGNTLFFATDKRKKLYSELTGNPSVELASYNLNTRKWIRINGKAGTEGSQKIREEMAALYPMIKQEYIGPEEIFFVIFKLLIEDIRID